MNPVAASLEGMRWAFAVAAGLCVVVLGLVAMLPARVGEPDLVGDTVPAGEPVQG
jgi:DHA2 family lincomycin resistance protein-like MFS transporter